MLSGGWSFRGWWFRDRSRTEVDDDRRDVLWRLGSAGVGSAQIGSCVVNNDVGLAGAAHGEHLVVRCLGARECERTGAAECRESGAPECSDAGAPELDASERNAPELDSPELDAGERNAPEFDSPERNDEPTRRDFDAVGGRAGGFGFLVDDFGSCGPPSTYADRST